jgi:hypothetical protein
MATNSGRQKMSNAENKEGLKRNAA